MQFQPVPNSPDLATLVNDGSVPYEMTASWNPALSQQAQAAQLAAFRANSAPLYDVVFSCEITAGSDLSLVSWQWTVVWFGGYRIFQPESLVRTDGSSIISAGYVNGAFVVKSSPPRWQKWGGIAPGATWREQLSIVLTSPASANASIAVNGCTVGPITRSISSTPRFGLRSQALDG